MQKVCRAKKQGIVMQSGVTKTTQLLIIGSGPGQQKLDLATKYEVPIIYAPRPDS